MNGPKSYAEQTLRCLRVLVDTGARIARNPRSSASARCKHRFILANGGHRSTNRNLIRGYASSMTKPKAIIIPVTPFQQNCTLLWCEATRRAVVIDRGGDLPQVRRAIAQAGVAVERIWLTHGHVDHVGGAAELQAELNVPIEGPHQDDLFLLQQVVETARAFGIPGAANVTP